MRKRIEYGKQYHWCYFALGVKNPYEEDRHDPHCLLHLAAFGHSVWIKIPQLFKPRQRWVDLTKESWATPGPDGRKGYVEYIQRDYGVSFNSETLHIHYGIQPGCWSSYDKANSDHSKVFWWPWHSTIVRHDLLYPDGEVYWHNKYPRKKGAKHLHWYEVDMAGGDVAVETTKFIELVHHTRDGRKQVAKITLRGEEREWRPRWTRWLPIFRKIRRVVDCSSDVELGEKAGSWKGGLMGWSAEWHKDESMTGAFYRWYRNWNGV